MNCPVCQSPTLATDAAGVRYCPVCAASGRDPLVGGSRMVAGEPATPVRGSSETQGAGSSGGRNKFGAVPEVVDGIRFASKGEARRYRDLAALWRAGTIEGLEVHPRYDLTVNGVLVGRYTADYRYRENGVLVVEDYKSRPTMTASYRLRKRLMLALHGIEIRETGK